MASINLDSELMTNYVSAVPLEAGGRFVTVLDERRRPMAFALGTGSNPKLMLLMRDASGRSKIIELNDVVRVPSNAVVQTFHVVQSWSLTLHMVVAWRGPDSMESSGIVVLRPFMPSAIAEDARLAVYGGEKRFGTIERIFMSPIGPDNPDNLYPDVYLSHKAFNQSTTWGSDLSSIRVNVDDNTWAPTFQMATPENVNGIIGVAPAVGSYGKGLYVLYNDSEGASHLYVRFLRPDPNSSDGNLFTTVRKLDCPKDATAIASFLTPQGKSSLLTAASDGIRLLTPQQATAPHTHGTLVHQGLAYLHNLREMSIAQDQDNVTLWFKTAKQELGYLRSINGKLEEGVSALVQPEGTATAFSACVTAPMPESGNLVRQMLMVRSSDSRLALLEQSSDLGLWKTAPFYSPSNIQSTPVQSYTVTLKAVLADNQPARHGRVFISSSSTVSALINGTNVLLTREATWFDCDAQGSLDFIVPTDSLSSQILRIQALRDGQGKDVKIVPITFDPTSKVMKKMVSRLEDLPDAKSLLELKTENGERLIPADAEIDVKDLKAARISLIEIGKAYNQFTSSSAVSSISASEMEGQASSMIAGGPIASAGLAEALMDGWQYVKNKVREAVDWVIQKAGAVWEFVCKIAGEVKRFVLDCVEKICEAASWVWEKIKVGWQKLCDFIGFIFNWNDILATKDTISSLLSNGMTLNASKVPSASSKVDEVCDNLIKNIDAWGNAAPNKPISNNSDGQDEKVKAAQTSTSCNWASERLKNGGAATSTKLASKPDESSDAQKVWEGTIEPALKDFGTKLQVVGKEILDLFTKDGSITVEKVIKIGKSTLISGVNVVRAVIKDVLKVAMDLIIKIRDLGNKPIEMPIFTWLYKQITGGHDLTIFDAISLVLAVPTTVFAKIITGKAPPKLPNLDATLLDKLYSGDKTIDKQLRNDFNILQIELTVGITLASAVYSLLKLFYKTITGGQDALMKAQKDGPSGFFDILGIAVDVISTLVALPDSADLPGAQYRSWIAYISCTRGVYHTIHFFTKGGDTADKIVLCVDLLTVFANLGLSVAVFIEEKKAASTWKDYNEVTTETTMMTNALNALSGVAYFTAFMFKHTNPPVSAVGAAAMVGTVTATAALEGMILKNQYESMKTPRLTQGPSF